MTLKKLRQINRHGGSGVLCICDTTVTKTANLQEGNNENTERDEDILCISGEAQVWLPGVVISAENT